MTKASAQPQTRRLAWDGVSFEVPHNWELALYKYPSRHLTRVEIEDEYAVRLEGEWTRPKRRLQLQQVQKRYEQIVHRLTRKAERHEIVSGLPDGWLATAYLFREGDLTRDSKDLFQKKQWLATVFFLHPTLDFFAYFLLHVYPDDRENPPEVIRRLANTLTLHDDQELQPWALFDIAFELPTVFDLESTHFDIGAKMMVFRWRLRRFYLWHFSLADHILQPDETPEEWVSAHLNGCRHIQGQVFYPATDGEITHRRKRRHPLGHRDEISRWSFKWKSRCYQDREKNQLIAWVFSYRRQEDLKQIPPSLRFGRDIFLNDTPPDPDWLEKKRKRQAGG